MPETVSILSEADISLPVAPGHSHVMHAITYLANGLSPRIVYVDPAEDTTLKRQQLIRTDIDLARGQAPNTIEVPEAPK